MKGGCFGSAQQRELIDAMEAAGVPPNTLVYAELMTSLQVEADSYVQALLLLGWGLTGG